MSHTNNPVIDLDEIFAAIDEAQRQNRYSESSFAMGVTVARLKCLADEYRARQAAPEAPTQPTNSNSAEFDGIKTAATTASASTLVPMTVADAMRIVRANWGDVTAIEQAFEANRAPAPSQEAQAANAGVVSDAEFLSKRLARVAKLAGVTMPDNMTYEQIAAVAGTILGDIARKLERSAIASNAADQGEKNAN